jgi:hypothetical protein
VEAAAGIRREHVARALALADDEKRSGDVSEDVR